MRAALALALAVGMSLAFVGSVRPASADHLMCGWRVEKQTQTVSIDPSLEGAGLTRDDVLAAFQPWNDLFLKYHGFPIFAEYTGTWSEADILLTAHGFSRTWVSTRCSRDYVARGANQSVIYLGRDDAWRNRKLLVHEMGHTLGLADHGAPAEHADGHIGFAPCDLRYIGVMSYCTSNQSWFLDYALAGSILDGQLVQRYW